MSGNVICTDFKDGNELKAIMKIFFAEYFEEKAGAKVFSADLFGIFLKSDVMQGKATSKSLETHFHRYAKPLFWDSGLTPDIHKTETSAAFEMSLSAM